MAFNDDDRASWAFVEGSISVTGSILIAYAISRCDRCAGVPVISFFKKLTEQEDGVLITGMALLFPTALAFYLGAKVVFAAYREYRTWRDARIDRIEQARKEALKEGRDEERARVKRVIAEWGVTLPPEVESALYREADEDT